MKTKFLMLIMLLLATIEYKAQHYGHLTYPVDSVLLSSAKVTTISSQGFIMGGYRSVRQNSSSHPDIAIHKTDANGQFTSGFDFSTTYQITGLCSGIPHQCAGVDIAECKSPVATQSVNQIYAMVATSTAGIGFATLDQSGVPLQEVFWAFAGPVGAFSLRKPAIRESSNPNIFYITCNTYNSLAFVACVDISATPINIIWSHLYDGPVSLEPRDLMESPYDPSELVVVGLSELQPNPSLNYWGTDGFFLKLKSGDGSVLTYSVYNKNYDGDDWFTCIEKAESQAGGSDGYILGGRSHHPLAAQCPTCLPTVGNTFYEQWICKLDPAGNVVWSKLISPSDNNIQGFNQEISRVYERLNPNTNRHEVYGVSAMSGTVLASPPPAVPGSSAIVVYKINDTGANTFTPSEFHYTGVWANEGFLTGFSDAQHTGIETGGAQPDDGLQIFGNDVDASNFLFVKTYFNGASGCNENIINIRTIYDGPDSKRTENVNWSVISDCGVGTIFSLWLSVSTLSSSLTTICSNTALAGGSNARSAITAIQNHFLDSEMLNIYPNPSNEKVFIELKQNDIDVTKIVLIDILGKIVHTVPDKGLKSNLTAIDLKSANISQGMYTVIAHTNHGIIINKISYTP